MNETNLLCDAKIILEKQTNESAAPSGKIEARATTWGAREGADGRKFNYQPEGFADWAKEFAESGKPLPMFLNHNDMGAPIGEWNAVEFDDKGMSAKGKLFLETSGGKDIYHILKESPMMFGGVSVGAYAEEACMVDEAGNPVTNEDDDGYFQITKGGLRELSVVMYPNNPQAEVMKLENIEIDGQLNIREIERTLREAGFTKKDATTASLAMKKRFKVEKPETTIQVQPNQREADAVGIEADQLLQAFQEWELLQALSKRIK